jgi:methyl-accepting chemotaxis protein
MENTKRVSFTNSIKTRLIAIMVALVIVPMFIAIIVSVVNTRKEGKKTANEINDAQAAVVESDISSIISDNLNALRGFAESPTTAQFIESGAEGDLEERVLSQMKEIDNRLADGNTSVVTGADGMQLLRAVGDLVDVSEREYFKQGMDGNTYVSDVNVSKTTGKGIITFVVPVWNRGHDKVVGIVQRNYDVSVLHDIIAEEVTEKRQEIVVVDRDGKVVAHSGHEVDPNEPEDQSGNPFYTDSRGDKLRGVYETKWEGDTWMVSWEKDPVTGWVIASCRVESVALSHVSKMTTLMVLIGIIFAIAGGLVAVVFAKSIIDPLKAINDSVSALAHGRFERISKYEYLRNELGIIVADTNLVIDTLDEIVSDIRKSADSVNTSSESLAETAEQISMTADNVSNAVTEIANGASQQADEIQSANESTGVISDNIRAVTTNAESVSGTAQNMNSDSKSSAEQLHMLKDSSDKMTVAIEEISRRISSTGEAVERISEKVAAINSIASQTNLLALNASIEAARAGDAGRGFAVVAEEIGKLADESTASANEIRNEMELLLSESNAAVAKAGEVSEVTENQKQILDATVETIAKLIDGIEDSVSGIESITSSAETCESSKMAIVDVMSSLSAISEENAAATEETSASMEELNAMVNNLAQAAQSLKDISDQLNSDMEFFQ